jgi:hypothetical protein
VPRIARLNVTPVKSTALNHPDEIRLERYGPVGDRDFFFVDEDGRRLSGTSKAPLLTIRADYDDERDRLEIRLPTGIVASGAARATGEALRVDFYGRPVCARVVEGDWNEAVSAYAGRGVRLARVDDPGAGTDVEPVTLVSLASVAELSRRGGREDPVDPGRFRMTFELDGCEPHEEDAWCGRRLRIGGAVVRIGVSVPRCVITTLDPKTGVRDFPTLSVIKSYRGRTDDGLPFGVYGQIEEPGVVRVGDPVQPGVRTP